jgi:hypothetical protein
MTAIKAGVGTVAEPLIPKNSATIREKIVLERLQWGNPFFQRIGINFKTAK